MMRRGVDEINMINKTYLEKVIKQLLILMVMKAKPIGTISQRKDGKYKKVSPDEWIKIKDTGGKEKEDFKKPLQPKQIEPRFPDYTEDPAYNKLAETALANVNDESVEALYRYTKSAFWDINKKLRGEFSTGSDTNVDEDIALMDQAFKDAPINGMTTPRLFRGAILDKSIIEKFRVGSSFTDKGFVSTTSDESKANKFRTGTLEKNEIPVLFTILNGDGQFTALPIANLNAAYAEEKEFLMNRSIEFEVVNVKDDKELFLGESIEFMRINIIVRN